MFSEKLDIVAISCGHCASVHELMNGISTCGVELEGGGGTTRQTPSSRHYGPQNTSLFQRHEQAI